jgi:hypothetical protein
MRKRAPDREGFLNATDGVPAIMKDGTTAYAREA